MPRKKIEDILKEIGERGRTPEQKDLLSKALNPDGTIDFTLPLMAIELHLLVHLLTTATELHDVDPELASTADSVLHKLSAAIVANGVGEVIVIERHDDGTGNVIDSDMMN